MKAYISVFLFISLLTASASHLLAQEKGYQLGATVSSFNLKDATSGGMVSIDDYQSKKGVIVIFDCNTCPYSKRYNTRIIALNDKYASKGYPVIAINPNDTKIAPGDSFELMAKQASEKKYNFPYLRDETQAVAKAFGATNTPHVYVLKKTGNNFIVEYIGAIDDSPRDAAGVRIKYVEDAVDALLIGKKVPDTHTKAIGCTIKWTQEG